MNPDWHQLAAAQPFNGNSFIDGVFTHGLTGGAMIQTTNPADGKDSLKFNAATIDTVNQAVASARNAFDDGRWERMSPSYRRATMLKLADLIQSNATSLALSDSLDVGKPIMGAMFEAQIAAGFVRYYAEALDKHYNGNTVPTCSASLEIQVRRARGVVLAITPWNYPLVNTCLKIAPALAAGNSVIVKPSSISPRSAEILAQLAIEAGIPAGVLNVVQGNGKTGDLLVRHQDVDMVTFTGSTQTGRYLMAAVGDSALKPLLLECGGKNREFVLDDMVSSDIDGMAMQIVQGAFANSGQLCVARSALYIQDSLYDALTERIVSIASSMQAGHPLSPDTRYGPMACSSQRNIAHDYIDIGVAEGARLLLDGRRPSGVSEGGFYVQPTVFSELRPDSRLNTDEIFGPILTLNRFSRTDEVLAIANAGDYGLAATLWTRDLKNANDIATRMKVGKVKVMSTPVGTEGSMFSQSAEPTRQSGFGIEGGLKGMESYMRQQVIEYAFG
ncbi:MAG: aldehyde dehydrogenase family protein [Burkholderiales bacterium]|jgi:gamma-glutamyl-gamma-aminobutyraldehyde dehydrogenase